MPEPLEGTGQGTGQDGGQDGGRAVPVLYLWPENAPVWALFLALQTQWRVGMEGATGLDYSAVQAAMHMLGLPRKERAETFVLVQVMEREVLAHWERERRRKERRR